jgi:hypothetical protein
MAFTAPARRAGGRLAAAASTLVITRRVAGSADCAPGAERAGREPLTRHHVVSETLHDEIDHRLLVGGVRVGPLVDQRAMLRRLQHDPGKLDAGQKFNVRLRPHDPHRYPVSTAPFRVNTTVPANCGSTLA